MSNIDQYELQIPDNQQEDEDDLNTSISFKESVVMNADWTIETIDSQIRKGNIDLQPSFQRRGAWDDKRKSRLIESIIVGMPVPNIVLAEQKDHRGRFIVIDGKQRLMAINEFLADDFKLKGLDIRPELNGQKYSELPSEDREYLDNSTLRSTVIRSWQDENFLYAIFYRLNSGSLPLSPQELRKALIGGKLLDEIETYLSQSNQFHALFGQSLDKRMRDSELVLRFIAYNKRVEEYRGNFKEFLDEIVEFYEKGWLNYQQEVVDALNSLNLALDTTVQIFGDNSFKKWLGTKYERVINRAIFDCIARFFSDQNVSQAALQNASAVEDAFKDLCMDQDYRDSVEKTPKTTFATHTRIDMWGRSLAHVLGMQYDGNTRRIL
ncbi:DUF262 domain-containing protein [Escherichia coli]|uniref:GmrSD restriction endonucleases N-terminal domain-containing protein n=1 Tax=Escherichia coli TaxID=562 RepID=A0A4C9HJM3_ECOLX|nr:DUF262 domain-containing protein [Escherichia coli]EJT2828392.1 DUF262 domain-containing protein [Shigella boydii]EKF4350624.1 DUF262 domain-containing protein [Escherichia coli O136]EKP4086271.1 DUF262 domain-containing protein [Escherichia coli O157]APL69684.1 hypothetical protein RG70_03825 [Escherichia coli]EEQ1623662.1 DUF262 domain-containing protein [Escherichia coli]